MFDLMGACISSPPKPVVESESRSPIESMIKGTSTPEVICPIPDNVAEKCRLSSSSTSKFYNFGSTNDVFFDSQLWLESDGDDEFLSVNGDLTPYVTPRPALWQKSLAELFLESDDEGHENHTKGFPENKIDKESKECVSITLASRSASSTPSVLELHLKSETSTHENSKKHTSSKSAQCLPKMFFIYSSKTPSKKISVVV